MRRTMTKRAKSLVVAAVALLATASVAQAWTHGFERGVDLYQADSNGVRLILVCDPDNVYGSGSESALRFQVGGLDDYSGPVQLGFGDDVTVTADATHGSVGKRFVPAETWEPLIENMRQSRTVSLTIEGQTREVDTGEAAEFTCR